MSRRRRAIGFALAASLAAAAAAAAADGYGDSVAAGYGRLRPVLVASRGLAADVAIDPATAALKLEVRRVPVRFAPAGALGNVGDAVGLAPVAAVPAGSYVLATQLRPPRERRATAPLPGGRRPVEIEAEGVGALSTYGVQPVGSRVEVVVTTEPSGAGSGRTYVAASMVPLLGIGPAGEAAAETSTVTLGLTRRQALRLIAAESFARKVTVIPSR